MAKTNRQLAEEFCAKFPEKGNRTIANALYAAYPERFTTQNACQCAVRAVRGANGARKRKQHKLEKTITPAYSAIPKSSSKPRKAYQLPQGKTLILSDIHVPFHSEEALACALEYGDNYKPDNILLNGDTIDFYAISRWEKDPEVRSLANEIEKTRQLVMHLRARYPKAKLIWKNGNHEDRWEAYLWNKAPELIGVSDFEMRKILRLDENGFDFVHSKQKIKAGKHMTIIHGHEIYGVSTVVNPARTLAAKLKVCAMKGHNHQVSEHTERTADDKYISCWSTGCLSELNPDYLVFNNWSHGCATIDLNGDKFHVNNMRIINGKIM